MDYFSFVAVIHGAQDLLQVVGSFILVQVLLGNDVVKQLSAIQTGQEYKQ